MSLVIFFAVNCAPAPVDKVDLSKARTGFMLTNGQTVSSTTADDYNPQLVHKEDGTLYLIFGSNRSCSPCTANNYHIFVAVSVAPYTPNPYYVADLPRFNNPVTLNNAGAEITLGTARGNFNATWTQGKISIVLEHGGQIKGVNITAANAASANTAGVPAALANTSRIGDKLLMANFKDFTILTVLSGVVRKSAMNSVDAGIVQTNPKLAVAGSATLAHYAYSGYADYVFYNDAGRLSSGEFATDWDSHLFFNDALSESNLTLGYVSTLRTPVPKMDIFLFSAQSTAGISQSALNTSNLYMVDSHTAAELFLLDNLWAAYVAPVYFPGTPTNYPPYKIFVSTTATNGSLGGVFGADAICNSDFTAMPDQNVYYTALLADGVFRSSPASLNFDWPLDPLTKYIRGDTGATIQTTDASGVFPFALTTAINAGNVWTGLNNNWTDGVNTCFNGINDWYDGTVGSSGDIGSAASTTNTSINTGAAQTCNVTAKLYCVEQLY